MIYSILIIDDNAEDRYLLKRYLKKSGLELSIAEANNGEEALEFLTKFDQRQKDYPQIKPPLLLFLDVNMPIMNGWDFLEEFHARQAEIQLKPSIVIMYSTSDEQEERERIKNYQHVSSYIVKGSYTPEELKQAVIDSVNRYDESE